MTEPDRSKITPEHIQQAYANLTRRPRRLRRSWPMVAADLVRHLCPAIAVGLFGNVIAYGAQHGSLQLKLVGGAGAAATIVWFWIEAAQTWYLPCRDCGIRHNSNKPCPSAEIG